MMEALCLIGNPPNPLNMSSSIYGDVLPTEMTPRRMGSDSKAPLRAILGNQGEPVTSCVPFADPVLIYINLLKPDTD